MKKLRLLLSAVSLVLLLGGCDMGLQEFFWRKSPVDSRTTRIEALAAPDPSLASAAQKYTCLILADPHWGKKSYTPPEHTFFIWLNKFISDQGRPKFCVILGDVVDRGSRAEFEKFARFQKQLTEPPYGIPVYNVPGNHDLYNSGWRDWEKICFPHKGAFYFETKAFAWYFLDTANGTLGRPQFYDLKEKIETSAKPKLLFTHYPLYANKTFYYSLSNTRERMELIAMFAQMRVKLYCSGHYHKGARYDFGPFNEYTAQSFGRYEKCHVLYIDEQSETFTIKEFDVNSAP